MSHPTTIPIGTHKGPRHTADEFLTLAIELLYYKKKEQPITVFRSDDWDLSKESARFPGIQHHEKSDTPGAFSYCRLAWSVFGRALCSSDAAFEAFKEHFIRPAELFEQTPLFGVLSKTGVAYSWNAPLGYQSDDVHGEFRRRLNQLADHIEQFIEKLEPEKIPEPIIVAGAPHSPAAPDKEIKLMPTIDPSQSYHVAADGRIAVVHERGQVDQTIAANSDFLFIVYPNDEKESHWVVRALKQGAFPRKWRTSDSHRLQKLTGAEDALSCQDSGKFAKAKSARGAVKIAEAALLAA